MATRLHSVSSRARLKPRRDPYFERLSVGLHVGYRKMQADSTGTWSIRLRDPDNGKAVVTSLGTLENYPDNERFDKAAEEGRRLLNHASAGGITTAKTIKDVCNAYVKFLSSTKGEAAAHDARRRFDRYVLDDARFASLELQKLKPSHISDWRQRLTDKPVHRGSGRGGKGSKATDQQRSASSLNRDMTPFRAALNHSFDNAWVTNDFAWRSKLKPIANADRQRAGGYLTRAQRQRLIDAAKADETGVEILARVLCGLPIRPGALAKLRVKNFNTSLNELSIKLDKTGERKIVLPSSMAELFKAACADKLPEAFIFTRADGTQWNKDAWKGPFKRAVLDAGLNESTVMYSLRHAVITDMVAAGVDLLTVSRLSGTSMAMLQKHYGHLIPSVAAAAIASVAI
ncbi:MAG: hypothetical protein RLZZ591_1661 [Pseudomonadota bacterium]